MSDPRRMSATVGPTADSTDGDRLRGRKTPRVSHPRSRLPSLTAAPVWVLFVVRVLVIFASCALLGLVAGLLGDGPR